jgi:hypothetical protein
MVLFQSANSISLDDAENMHMLQSTTGVHCTCEDNPTSTNCDSRDRKHAYSSLIAGLSSGAISSTICAPLDLVRTRIQVMGEIVNNQQKIRPLLKEHIAITMLKDIIQKDGLAGCFRGLTATLLTVPTFWGVYC